MPGGPFDSSLTRVAPVFDRLSQRHDDWVRSLLHLVRPEVDLSTLDLRFVHGYWGRRERSLDPPISLLSWLIRHPTPELHAQDELHERSLLARGDPETVELALIKLRSTTVKKGWHILEGPTYPDAFLETADALIVVEGKRTEPGPTIDTTWLKGRHQIWRHIDAAWELRGRRQVFGFFIVEGVAPGGSTPELWLDAFEDAARVEAIKSSLPHRGEIERAEMAKCFLGGTTWQRVCQVFGLDFLQLPDRVDSATKH